MKGSFITAVKFLIRLATKGASFSGFVVGIITLGTTGVVYGLVVRVGEGITRIAVGVTVKTAGDLAKDGVPGA